jgi:hypothetical protein
MKTLRQHSLAALLAPTLAAGTVGARAHGDPSQASALSALVLGADTQARLLPLLRDNQRLAAWHTPHYNMLAYPWAQTYQQSNQWAIETLAGASDPAASPRRQAQAWLQSKGYEPTTLRLGPLTRLGARATAANIAFDDHPNDKRFSDRIETVTVDSVFVWLQRSGLGAAPMTVRLPATVAPKPELRAAV